MDSLLFRPRVPPLSLLPTHSQASLPPKIAQFRASPLLPTCHELLSKSLLPSLTQSSTHLSIKPSSPNWIAWLRPGLPGARPATLMRTPRTSAILLTRATLGSSYNPRTTPSTGRPSKVLRFFRKTSACRILGSARLAPRSSRDRHNEPTPLEYKKRIKVFEESGHYTVADMIISRFSYF